MADSGAARKSFPWAPVLMVAGAAAFVGYHLVYVLTPFALSATLAYIVNPVITYFEIRGIRRDVVVVGFYASVLGLLSVAGGALAPAIGREMNLLQTNAPVYMTRFQASMDEAVSYVARRLPIGSEALEKYSQNMYDPLIKQFQNLPHYLVTVLPVLSLLFLVPFITFFLLMDGGGSINAVIQAIPSRYVEQSLYLLSEIENSLGNYLRGLFIVALAIATASWIGLEWLGVNYALAIAILAGVSSFVPYMGAIVGAVVGGMVAGFQFGTVKAGLWVVALFSGIRMADEALLVPIISKHSVHMHPLAYLLSMMIGGETFGFVGLVFAVPAACILKSLIKVWWDWYSSEGYFDTEAPFESTHIPYT